VLRIGNLYEYRRDTVIEALECRGVGDLLRAGRLTLDQLLEIRHDAIRALEDPETAQRFQRGELTLDHVLPGNRVHNRPRMELVEEKHAPEINTRQSTHTVSVHASVSQAAKDLHQRYRSKITSPEALQNVLKDIQKWKPSLGDDVANRAAQAAISRIIHGNSNYVDGISNVSTKELLALVWCSIHDDSRRQGTLKDALQQFGEGLYEIQRGYNLDNIGQDRGGSDKSICQGGTFNKLVEKLAGIDPSVEMKFITLDTFSLKLPCIVREEAQDYLASKHQDMEEKEWECLVDGINNNGIGEIWEQIEENVANRMFDEFGVLFKKNRKSPDFLAAIDAGQYTNFKFSEELFRKDGAASPAAIADQQPFEAMPPIPDATLPRVNPSPAVENRGLFNRFRLFFNEDIGRNHRETPRPTEHAPNNTRDNFHA